MLTKQQTELLPERIDLRLKQLNTEVLEQIGNKIKEIGEIRPTDAHKLVQIKECGADIAYIENRLSEITGKSLQEIDRIFETTAKENYAFSEKFYKAKGLPFVPYEKNAPLQRLVKSLAKQSKDTFINMAKTTAFMVYDESGQKVLSSLSKVYNNVIDKAVLSVTTGVTDYQSAMRKTLRDLADSGIRTVYQEGGRAGKTADYANGYSRRLDTAVRQNILWGVKQCNQNTADLTGEEFGADGYEIDWHGGARPSHQEMGGKQYAIGRARTVKGKYYPSFDTVAPLLEEYGCLHFKFSILLGISEPVYSDKELARLKEADRRVIEFEGKEYTVHEATQMQRKLEAAARHAKDRQIIAKAARDEILMRQEQLKINQITQKYHEFSKAAGLPVKTERMQAAGYHRVKTAGELSKTKKSLTKENKGGKINNKSLFRKKKTDEFIEPMPSRQLHVIEKAFKKNGGKIQRNAETDAYLNTKNVEGITYNATTILLKQRPGRASVFEELIHTSQYKQGKIDGSALSIALAEVEAKEKLLKYAKAYKLTKSEIVSTEKLLKMDRADVKNLLKKGK